MKKSVWIYRVAIVLLLNTQLVFGHGKVIKRVSNYVLIDTDQGIGAIGDVHDVFRDLFNETQRTGSVEIVRFKNGQAAAKIRNETMGLQIEVGDYIRIYQDETDIMNDLFGETGSTVKQSTKKSLRRRIGLSYDMIYGPLPGVTMIPDKGRVIVGAQAAFLRANSMYDENGTVVRFNQGVENMVDPMITVNTINIDFLYAFRKNACLGISLPMVLTQKLDLNPLTDIGEQAVELNGLTGIGDIRLGGRILLGRGESSRYVLDGGFRFATGSSYDDLTETNFAPTGMGNTAVYLGVGADFFSRLSLFAISMSYVINNEATYTYGGASVREKPGDQFVVDIRAGYKFSNTALFGARASYESTGDGKVEGVTQNGTNSNGLSLTPLIAVRFESSDSSISLFGGYLFMISGKNYFKGNGIVAGGLIYF